MEYKQGAVGRVFYVRFDHDENIHQSLTAFIKEQDIRSGVVHCIGALKDIECVAGPEVTEVPPKPHWKKIPSSREVVAIATIAWSGDEPSIHLHAAMGNKDEVTVGCIRGISDVFLLIEATIIEFTGIDAVRNDDPMLGIKKVCF